MTHDETRDELARMDGWTENGACSVFDPDDRSITTYENTWKRGDEVLYHHPHPPTLDGANAAVPEGYEWERTSGKWLAWEHEESFGRPINVPDHGRGHEMDDLYALALACRKAMEEKR